jgi:hypothetical protein
MIRGLIPQVRLDEQLRSADLSSLVLQQVPSLQLINCTLWDTYSTCNYFQGERIMEALWQPHPLAGELK